jgi:hypothetical protein
MEEKDSTFGLYCTEINSAQARVNPRRAIDNIAQALDSSEEAPIGGPLTFPSRHSKRSVSEEPDSESDNEKGGSHKKTKLCESRMPWSTIGPGLSAGPHPSCVATVKLLKLFNEDIKQAKFLLSVAPRVPENIPTSQWERILKGDAVDLDQILSSLHRITPAGERKARLGEAEITFGPAEATRKVTTCTEWSTAW